MKNSMYPQCQALARSYYFYIIAVFLIQFIPYVSYGQCVATKGTLEGRVYSDTDNNGVRNASEPGLADVLVQAYSSSGALVGTATTDAQGVFGFSGLTDGDKVRLAFVYTSDYSPALLGKDNGSSIQTVQVPACNVGFGLVTLNEYCNAKSEILTTCFVQGTTAQRPTEPTIVGIEYGFNSNSPARKFAMHGETGAIWGLAWKNSTKEIFSSAFVKQYSGLKYGHDAILKTSFNGSMYTTSLFVRLSDLGQEVGDLQYNDITNCNYGSQVGRIGLGSLVISPDEKYFYTVNIFNNTLVRVSSEIPNVSNTRAYKIPGKDAHAFALKYYNDKIYVGTTIPGDVASVWIFDPKSETFTDSGLEIDAGADWDAPQVIGGTPAHWLTDIDFTDNGDMLISLSDRMGHTYCNTITNRLDEQKGDLLIAWKSGNGWKLEDRSEGKEFFSDDFWVTNPTYHSEITVGSIFALPGSGSVVATVFDPELNSYSGGLHRYNTSTGKKEGSKELYTRETVIQFGKATGFGEVISACGLPEIEIGNLVWLDSNENGWQDADESGLANVHLYLYDDNCILIGQTITDSKGYYVFNQSNVKKGLQAQRTYYIGVAPLHVDNDANNYVIAGNHYELTHKMSQFAWINSDAAENTGDCDNMLIEIPVVETSHQFDLGFVPAAPCSLKIGKRVVSDKAVQKNDLVTFEINVINKGGTIISSINVEDKVPAGYKFIPELNPSWLNDNGILKATLNNKLLPGGQSSVLVTLGFDVSSKSFNFTNEVKISAIKDAEGRYLQNITSCLATSEDGKSQDFPPVCDLALIHKVDVDRIYTPDSKVTLVTTICNQGNIDAETYEITNYLNEELDFDPKDNPGWNITADLKQIKYSETKSLSTKTCRDYHITFTILEGVDVSQIVNYAEISSGACAGVAADFDFDSTPDDNIKNDNGGHPNTFTDNMMDDIGDLDEDDHDPAIIRLDLIDLSLIKTITTKRYNPGDLVTFNLAIKNEGNIPVSKVKIVDYLPENLILEDDTWTMDGGMAYKVISFPGNLQPGATQSTKITCRIKPNLVHPLVIRNTAEIVEMYDQYNENISALDLDSTPDNIMTNDIRSNEKNGTEDDISSVSIYLICPTEVQACYECRRATTPTNGQNVLYLKLAASEDEDWYVESSVGLYDISSPLPPANPVLLSDGYPLTIDPLLTTPEHVFYVIRAVHIDKQGFSLRLRNKFGDLEQITDSGASCSFANINLNGPRSLCVGTNATYTATSSIATTGYEWSIDGNIIPGVTSSTLNVNWGSYPIGVHTVQAAALSGCIAPSVLDVAIGEADKSAIACIGDFNVSLDGNCSITITPSMMIAGQFNTSSPYTVMLTDVHGNVIPNATLTGVHAGTKVMAKLIEGCGGNSCWSNINVEDKIPPVSICRDIALPCYKLDEYEGPFERDNCGGPVKNILVSEKITPLTCNDNYVKYIDRVYQATNKFGNKSALCSMRISVERPDLALLKFPRSFVMVNDSALICDNFEKDAAGHPSVTVTGVPTIAGLPVYPSFPTVCNIYAGYEDVDFGYIGCTRKIIRKWTVYEQWCSNGRMRTFNQVLEITDTLAPVIKPLPNMIVSTNGHGLCEGDVTLPAAVVTDVCSGVAEVDVTYPGGFINDFKGNTKIKLPVGIHAVTYTAYDGCHNSSQISFTVTVEDKTAPVAICKGEVVVGLNSNGQAYLYPRNVDDGSFDACGLDKMKVAKMVQGGLIPDSLFRDYIDFNCSDVGKTIMVALRVWDASGNSNSCMMNVTVQDKHTPKITCPANITIDCSNVFTGMNLAQYGTATAIDACGATVTELNPQFVLNSCRVGYIERTFVASDGGGSASCKQTITVMNTHYFDPLTNVVKPLDYEVNDRCSADELRPENLPVQYGYPVIAQSPCGMAAATYKDDVYTFVTGACYKIVRNWTVIDWCEMERLGTSYVPYTFQQIIKVNNTVPPFFLGNIPLRDTFLTAKGNCTDANVYLTTSARDLCTPDNKLRWIYRIDWNNDGTFDVNNNGFGNVAVINTTFPVGLHRVQWSFEDQCGNVVTRDQLILVRNNDKPTVSALEKISVSINPWDTNGDGKADIEKACIKAWTLNASSTSTCCVEPLTFSFTGNVQDSVMCFDCFDVGQDITVELWAHDCNGNKDFVYVKIDVQDNNDSDVCERFCIENAPTPAIVGSDFVCNGSSTILTATGGVLYHWNTGATTASITVSPAEATTYTVTVTNELRCTASASKTITVRPLPVVTINGANVCTGSSTTITATGGGTYLWSTGATGSSINVSPTVNTTYTVTVTGANGCTRSASRLITVYPLPDITVTGNSVICINQSTTLTASGAVSYLWNTGATTASITVSPVATTTYTVTATDSNGCSRARSQTVTVNGLSINVGITGNNVLCLGQSTTLTASGGISYIWSNNATTTAITVAPTATTTYTVTATDLNGCTGTSSRTVTVNPLPNANITGNNVCLGSSTTLTASGGGSYLWNNGATTSSINVAPLTNTTYTVTVTGANSCTSSASRLITVFPLPTVTITGSDVICVNESTNLTASGGVTYLWNTGATTATITVSPPNTTTYTVTATDNNGCTNTQSKTVTVNGLTINVNIIGDNLICVGETTTLTATGGIAYVWNTGATTASINVSPVTTTTYTVTATDINGCNGTASRVVNVNPLPAITIAGDNIICIGESTTITASGAVTYVWNTGATGASITVSPLSTTTYTVTGTDVNGCTNTATRTITVNSSANADITGDNEICRGGRSTLTASGGISYIWNNGATTVSILVEPIVTTTYIVTVTNANGCTGIATETVTVFPNPQPVISGDMEICVGETTTLTVSGGTSFLWNTGATTSSITVSPVVNTTYSVTVSDANGCVGSTSASVTVDPGNLVCETQNITVYLNPLGSVGISPADISTGTPGACANIQLSVFPNVFFCNDVGTVTVTLTVTNVNNQQTLTCTALVTVLDTLPPVLVCPPNLNITCDAFNPNAPLSTYGVAQVSDNCPLGLSLTELPIINITSCNVGMITRTFTATDNSNNSSQCVQLIDITNPSPFTEANITFPADVTISNCRSVSPDSIGRATVNQGAFTCARVGISFTDNIPPGQLCGGVFQRVWTVVDTCQFVQGSSAGIYIHTQNIVVNVQAPLIIGPMDTIFIQRDSMTCSARLNGVLHSAVGCNLVLSNNVNSNANFDVSGEYPNGITNVRLIARETCNNLADTLDFVVQVDSVDLQIICRKTYPIMTDILQVVDNVYNHAEIIQGCTNGVRVIASYSNTDQYDTLRTYTCGDLPFTPLGITIYFWYEGDQAPFTLCNSLVGLTDPNHFCMSPPSRITGSVKTENGQAVPKVFVDLDGSQMPAVNTTMTGNYAFPEMQSGGNYTLIPQRNDHPLEGISTLDLLFIQRHILGTEALTSPYRIIAADVNRDNRVTASDIVQLRKLILGIQNEFTSNTSWRMVDKSYVFPDPKNPFITPFNEKYLIEGLNRDMNIDWVGVKTGDVNGSYVTNFKDEYTDKRAANMHLMIKDELLYSGPNSIPVLASANTELSGFQMSLHINHADQVILSPGILSIENIHYVFNNGVLNISWHTTNKISINAGDVLFKLQIVVDKEVKLSELLSINEKTLLPEYYTPGNDVKKLAFRFIKSNNDAFVVQGNTPNPWNNETSIHFYVPKEGEVVLKIRDITGRMVYQMSNHFEKGDHNIMLTRDQLGTSGILIYEMTFGKEVKTMKMLNIK